MGTPHVHAAIIKAWADGAEIQFKSSGRWEDITSPCWGANEYRIKPKTIKYRLYLTCWGTIGICNKVNTTPLYSFERWLTDEQEIEV